jgi:carboxymethylenebutenolidase
VGETSEIAGLATYATGEGEAAVVVLHEWWGLVPHIMDIADRFAALGYSAYSPDMYEGDVAPETEPDTAEWLAARLNREQAVRDLCGFVAELRRRGHERVALLGFCMGGALAIATTAKCAVEATVAYYGVWPKAGERTITSPVLAHVAGLEGDWNWWAQPPQFRRWFEGMPNVEIHVYDDAQHAFFNDTNHDLYDEASAKLSWDRTLAFLEQHLKPR